MTPLIDLAGIALMIAAMVAWSYRQSEAPFDQWWAGIAGICLLWLLARALIQYTLLGGLL